jgi:hypothetical protein
VDGRRCHNSEVHLCDRVIVYVLPCHAAAPRSLASPYCHAPPVSCVVREVVNEQVYIGGPGSGTSIVSI